MEVVDAGEEVAEVAAGGAHDRRVAESRRVADERASELGQELVGRPPAVGQRRRAGVGDPRKHVVRVAAMNLEHAAFRQTGK